MAPHRTTLPLTVCLGVGLALAGTAAHGHDLWIEPSSFQPSAGELVWIGLRIGHPATGSEPVSRNPRQLKSFTLLGPEGESPIPGLDGRDPAGWIRPSAPGRYTVVLRSHPAVSILPAEKFESYLLEEGLEAVRDARARRGESDLPGTERYSRSLKALLTVAGPREAANRRDPEVVDRPLGLRLELIARADPQRLQPEDRLPVELRFEGRPLAGALVEAHRLRASDPERSHGLTARTDEPGRVRSGRHMGRPLHLTARTDALGRTRSGRHMGRPLHLTGRTDALGRVDFELPEDGPWLLTVVHMVPAPPAADEDSDEDWESVWSALTFSLGTN